MMDMDLFPSLPLALTPLIDTSGFLALAIAIALIGMSVVVSLILLISGILLQKNKGLSFTQQKRFGYFLGACLSALLSLFVIQLVHRPQLCHDIGVLFIEPSNTDDVCYDVRQWLDQYSILLGIAIVASGILGGALMRNIRRVSLRHDSKS